MQQYFFPQNTQPKKQRQTRDLVRGSVIHLVNPFKVFKFFYSYFRCKPGSLSVQRSALAKESTRWVIARHQNWERVETKAKSLDYIKSHKC